MAYSQNHRKNTGTKILNEKMTLKTVKQVL